MAMAHNRPTHRPQPASGDQPTIAATLHRLQQQGLPRLEAQMLVLHALGRSPRERAWLLVHDADPLPAGAAETLRTLAPRRLSGEPMAYLIGEVEFHGLPLRVNPQVLVPRPDTETLVDWAVDLIPPDAPVRVLDLGTGSGAVALAIAQARPRASVTATDASTAALAVARGNIERLGLRLALLHGDWHAPLGRQRFDLIVSNPPYIAAGDEHLAALRHEPEQALVGGVDGLHDLRRIIAGAHAHLYPGGWLLLEHGWDQAAAVRQLLSSAGFAQVQSRRDLAGRERCSGGVIAPSRTSP